MAPAVGRREPELLEAVTGPPVSATVRPIRCDRPGCAQASAGSASPAASHASRRRIVLRTRRITS
jgi:hypothetical protein